MQKGRAGCASENILSDAQFYTRILANPSSQQRNATTLCFECDKSQRALAQVTPLRKQEDTYSGLGASDVEQVFSFARFPFDLDRYFKPLYCFVL